MKVLMTGGGSAGHITPILSVATELKKLQPRMSIRYVGQRGDSLGSLTDVSGSPIDSSYAIFAGKWRRYHGIGLWAHIADWRTILKNFRDLLYFTIGFVQGLWLLIRWRPQVVFVKGGFVGLPIGLAAVVLRISVVTHDSDVLPGLTNRILAPFAARQCVALPVKYYAQYERNKLVHTGVPTSEKFHDLSETARLTLKKHLQIPDDAQVLTIFGGSLGAIRLNEAVLEAAPLLLAKLPKLHIMHVTGSQQAEEIAVAYDSLDSIMSSRVWSWPFLPNLHEITGVADVVIARAGATSMAELGQQKKAVILVPNPYLVGGHQIHNARLAQENDAAVVISEKQLNAHDFDLVEAVYNLINDSKKQQELADNLHKLGVRNSATKIARILVETAK